MDSTTQTIQVDLGSQSYSIQIGNSLLPNTGSWLANLRSAGCANLAPGHALLVTDRNVEAIYADPVEHSLQAAGWSTNRLVVPAGEHSKSATIADQLWQQLLVAGADRKSIVVALGGGVVGDLAGFVAATFARGISLVQIPTTLLAQVDSSVGGKTGINLPGAKNMVGAFWQPKGVLIDTRVLSTLADREYRAGLAEVIKYGVIMDDSFFDYLENHIDQLNQRDDAVLGHVVARCCRLKADVVEQDEREETGVRALLNYGHTFCHALEAATGYDRLLHGEAVAIGMDCAARLAERLGRVDHAFVNRQQRLLAAVGLPTAVPDVPHKTLLELMQRDKKTEHGRLRFVLPTRMGQVEVVDDIDSVDIVAALQSESPP